MGSTDQRPWSVEHLFIPHGDLFDLMVLGSTPDFQTELKDSLIYFLPWA